MVKGTPNQGIHGTLTDGLLAHWCFNDGSLVDISGNGNDLKAIGTPALGIDKDGETGQALILNDVNYLYLDNLFKNKTFYSASFIFKVFAVNTPIFAISTQPSGDSNSTGTFFVLSNGNLGFYNMYQGSSNVGINVLDNKFHHLVFNAQSDGTYVYIDKKYIGKFNQVISNTNNYINLGKLNISGGDIIFDEMRLYSRHLTGTPVNVGDAPTDEIAEIFTMGANYNSAPLTFNTINVSEVSNTSVKLNINCNVDSTAYYKLYDKNAIAPTSEQLRIVHDGEIALTENLLSTTNVIGLTPNLDYDLYVVAEDTSAEKNLQIEPTKISFFTKTKGTPNAGQSGTLANGLLSHLCFNDGSLQDISGNGNKAIAVGTPASGVDKDGESGQTLILNDTNYIYLNKFLQGSTNISGSFIFKVVAGNTPIMAFASGFSVSKGTFYVMSNGNLGIYNTNTADTGINILDNKYHQLLFISNSTGTNLYLDKKYIGKFVQTVDASTSAIYFGKLDISGGDVNIDEIRFYNRRLTGETAIVNQEPTLEIAEIFTMGANYEVDVTPPTFNTINTSDTSSTSTKLNINCNEDATVYYKILSKSDAEPTPLQLKNSHDGIINLTANITSQTVISLNEKQSYKLVVIAEDLHYNVQNNITVINLDISPPTFNIINISNITYNSIRLNVNCNEKATVYYKISSRNNIPPSSIELKSYNGGSLGVSENTLSDIDLGGLLESTEYSLYAVAEDSLGNLQTSPTRIDFSTIANDKDIRLSLGMFSDVLSPAYYNGFFQSLEQNGFTSKNDNMIFLNPNVLPKIYEYGIEKNGETLTYNLQIPILPQEEKIIWIENYISPTSDNFNFSGAVADLDKYYGKYDSIQYAKEFKNINDINDSPYPFLLITDKIYNDYNGDIVYKDFDNSNIHFSFLPSDKEGYKSKIIIKNTLPDNSTKLEISAIDVITSTLEISIDAFSAIKIGNVIKLKEIKNMSDPFYNIYKSNYDVKYKIINKHTENSKFYITLDKVYPFYKYNNSYITCELFNENIILLNYLSIRGNPIISKTGEYEIKDTGSIDRYGDKLYKIQSSLFPLSYYERLGKTIVSERKSANKINDIQYEYKKEYTKFIAEFNLEHYLLNIGDLIYITEDYYYNIINEPFQIISIKRTANGSERGSKIIALSCRLLKDNTYNNVFKEVEASNIKSISSLDPTDYLTDKNILATRYVTPFGEAYNSIGKTTRVVSKMDKIVKFSISDFTNIDTSNIVFAINDVYYQTTLVEQDSQYLSFLLINDKVENIDSVKVNDIAYIYQNELTTNKSYTVSEYQSSRTSNKLYFSYSLKDVYDSIIVRIYESNTYESATMLEDGTEPTLILQTQTRENKFLIGNSENCNLKYDVKYDKYYTIHLTIVSLQEDLYPQEKITVYTPTNSYTIDYKGGA